MDGKLVVIGADVGNGYTKIDFGETFFQLPSLVAKGKDRKLARVTESFSHENILIQQLNVLDVRITDHQEGTQEHYFCGSLAHREGIPISQWSDDKGESLGARALLLTAIALGIKGSKALVYLSASLPVKNYTRFKQSYEENMVGEYTVEFFSGPLQGTSKFIKVLRCRVYPEGLGVYIREVHERKQADLASGFQALIAPGFRTTEFLLFSDGTPLDDLSGSLEFGIASAHKRVANKLSQTYGSEYSEHEIDQMFLTKGQGKVVDIQAQCDEEFANLSDLIFSKLRIKWQDVWGKIENFIISDGGGQALYQHFHHRLSQSSSSTCYLVDESQFANAKGNRAAALLALSGGNGNGQR